MVTICLDYADIDFEFNGYWEGGKDDGYFESFSVFINNGDYAIDVTEILSQEVLRELELKATEKHRRRSKA